MRASRVRLTEKEMRAEKGLFSFAVNGFSYDPGKLYILDSGRRMQISSRASLATFLFRHRCRPTKSGLSKTFVDLALENMACSDRDDVIISGSPPFLKKSPTCEHARIYYYYFLEITPHIVECIHIILLRSLKKVHGAVTSIST